MIEVERPLRSVAERPDIPLPPPWTEQALCATHEDPDLWFPERGDLRSIRKAAAICAMCPVREQCRAAGKYEAHGVWAGEFHDPFVGANVDTAPVRLTRAALCNAGVHRRTRENVYAVREGQRVTFGCRDCDAEAA